MRISDWSSDVCSSDLARAPGRFAAALSALGELGCTSLLEVGPGTTLSDLARPQTGATHMVSALGGGDEVASLLEALAPLPAHGVAVDWRAVLPAGPRAQLQGYPFQSQAYLRSDAARPATKNGGA